MTRFRCRAYRALLVDYAAGGLDAAQQRTVERHLHACRRCTAEVAALREVAAALRTDTVPDPGEAFWVGQRQAIARAIRTAPDPRASSLDWVRQRWHAARWRYPLALAASAAMALLVYRLSVRLEVPTAEPDAQVASLDNELVLALHDVMQAVGPPDEYLPPTADTESDLTALAMGDLIGVRPAPEVPSLNDLDEADLDGVGGLIGDTTIGADA